MWGARYWGARYWGARYWGKGTAGVVLLAVGSELSAEQGSPTLSGLGAAVGGYWGNRYWGRYWGNRYWATGDGGSSGPGDLILSPLGVELGVQTPAVTFRFFTTIPDASELAGEQGTPLPVPTWTAAGSELTSEQAPTTGLIGFTMLPVGQEVQGADGFPVVDQNQTLSLNPVGEEVSAELGTPVLDVQLAGAAEMTGEDGTPSVTVTTEAAGSEMTGESADVVPAFGLLAVGSESGSELGAVALNTDDADYIVQVEGAEALAESGAPVLDIVVPAGAAEMTGESGTAIVVPGFAGFLAVRIRDHSGPRYRVRDRTTPLRPRRLR